MRSVCEPAIIGEKETVAKEGGEDNAGGRGACDSEELGTFLADVEDQLQDALYYVRLLAQTDVACQVAPIDCVGENCGSGTQERTFEGEAVCSDVREDKPVLGSAEKATEEKQGGAKDGTSTGDMLVGAEDKRADERAATAAFLLKACDIFVFDMDGVIWRSGHLLPRAPEVLKFLRDDCQKTVLFASNNSTSSRAGFVDKFQNLGLGAFPPESFYCTAWMAAEFLKNHFLQSPKLSADPVIPARDINEGAGTSDLPLAPNILVMGVDGLARSIEAEMGDLNARLFNVQDRGSDPHEMDKIFVKQKFAALVVGFDPHMSYFRLAVATCILREQPGCLFVVTNEDLNFPAKNHVLPGNGSMVRSLIIASGRQPIVAGKPSQMMASQIVQKLGVLDRRRVCMVGDNLLTDIKFGNVAGFRTLLVESGMHTEEDIARLVSRAEGDSKLRNEPDYRDRGDTDTRTLQMGPGFDSGAGAPAYDIGPRTETRETHRDRDSQNRDRDRDRDRERDRDRDLSQRDPSQRDRDRDRDLSQRDLDIVREGGREGGRDVGRDGGRLLTGEGGVVVDANVCADPRVVEKIRERRRIEREDLRARRRNCCEESFEMELRVRNAEDERRRQFREETANKILALKKEEEKVRSYLKKEKTELKCRQRQVREVSQERRQAMERELEEVEARLMAERQKQEEEERCDREETRALRQEQKEFLKRLERKHNEEVMARRNALREDRESLEEQVMKAKERLREKYEELDRKAEESMRTERSEVSKVFQSRRSESQERHKLTLRELTANIKALEEQISQIEQVIQREQKELQQKFYQEKEELQQRLEAEFTAHQQRKRERLDELRQSRRRHQETTQERRRRLRELSQEGRERIRQEQRELRAIHEAERKLDQAVVKHQKVKRRERQSVEQKDAELRLRAQACEANVDCIRKEGQITLERAARLCLEAEEKRKRHAQSCAFSPTGDHLAAIPQLAQSVQRTSGFSGGHNTSNSGGNASPPSIRAQSPVPTNAAASPTREKNVRGVSSSFIRNLLPSRIGQSLTQTQTDNSIQPDHVLPDIASILQGAKFTSQQE